MASSRPSSNNNSFFGLVSQGINLASQFTAIKHYRETSTIYKNMLKEAYNLPNDLRVTRIMQQLKNATSFPEFIKAAELSEFKDPGHNVVLDCIGRMLAFVLSFFEEMHDSKWVYYGFQLKNDVINYAFDNGFTDIKPESTPENSSVAYRR